MKLKSLASLLLLLSTTLSFGQTVNWGEVWSQTPDDNKQELVRTCMLAFDMTASLYQESAADFEKQFPADGTAMVKATEDWFYSFNAYRRGNSALEFVSYAVAGMDEFYADPKNARHPFTDALAVAMISWKKSQEK